MATICLGVLVLLIALALRAVPLWLSPAGAGVDHWFWKSYIEEYRRNRRFPPSLPQYVLDEHQWYPPVFPLLLAFLPPALFDGWNRAVAISIDLLRMTLLLAVAYWQSNGNPLVVALAGLVYATTPIQISYNIQLNPRGLAALMLDVLLILLLVQMVAHGPWWIWAAIVLLSGIILLTHKMTTQLFWFIVLGTAGIYRHWWLLLLIPASAVSAMILSRGFYWKVLRAHWDIVSFWHRNWPWIGADLIRESPIYGDGTYERPEKLHQAGWRGFFWHWTMLLGFSPAAWIACLLTYERLTGSPFLIYPTPLLVWLLLPCLFALLTTFVKPLKCLGAGYLYVYNTSMLASLLLALTFQYTRAPRLSTPFVGIALTLNVVGVLAYYRQFMRSKRGRVHEGLEQMMEVLREMPRGVVMCVPANWYEVVAYKTGQPVLWGAHGYGFRNIEPLFPRFLIPIGEILERYHVCYLLTMEGILTPAVADALPPASRLRKGEYQLYCFQDAPRHALDTP
jgi:hypothetical protein